MYTSVDEVVEWNKFTPAGKTYASERQIREWTSENGTLLAGNIFPQVPKAPFIMQLCQIVNTKPTETFASSSQHVL